MLKSFIKYKKMLFIPVKTQMYPIQNPKNGDLQSLLLFQFCAPVFPLPGVSCLSLSCLPSLCLCCCRTWPVGWNWHPEHTCMQTSIKTFLLTLYISSSYRLPCWCLVHTCAIHALSFCYHGRTWISLSALTKNLDQDLELGTFDSNEEIGSANTPDQYNRLCLP